MGKRRHAAKTGDKKLYAIRNAVEKPTLKNPHDIDSFHDGRGEAFLALDAVNEGSEDDEQFETKQNVLDLAVGDDSCEEESEDSTDEDDIDSGRRSPHGMSANSDEGSDDEDEMEALDRLDARQWGRKKSAYYDGDLADLELGVQAEDDAFVEEEAAREVQASRWDEMQEDDFVPSADEEESDCVPSRDRIRGATVRDTEQLSSKEKRRLLTAQHPEFLPVASHFSEILKDFLQATKVATDALVGQNEHNHETAKSVGASKQGLQLLLTKSLTEQSALLNTVLYLLVKSSIAEDDDAEATSSIETHPVMLQLKRSNAILATLSETVFRKVDGLEDQIRNLVQAAALLSNDNGSKEHDEAFSEEERAAHGDDAVDVNDNDNETSMEESSLPEHPVGMEPGNSSRQRALAEARFGLRKHEVKLEINRKRRKAFSDFEFEAGESRDTKGLASTINAIDQRSSKKSKRSKDQPFGKELEYHDDEVAAGLRMMEAELEGGEEGLEIDGESGDFDDVDEHEEFDDHEFYDKMADAAKKKKQLKTEIHAVAPKFPTFEGEVEGERAISRTILKNRGLVPHKNRINRNPRVKKRVQYQKALIRRKGAVREVRTNEGHYDGEGTGIKSGISRSRKLKS